MVLKKGCLLDYTLTKSSLLKPIGYSDHDCKVSFPSKEGFIKQCFPET